MKAYVDGVAKSLLMGNGAGINDCNTTSAIAIGAGIGSPYYYNGSLDDVRVYNRALHRERSQTAVYDAGCRILSENVV